MPGRNLTLLELGFRVFKCTATQMSESSDDESESDSSSVTLSSPRSSDGTTHGAGETKPGVQLTLPVIFEQQRLTHASGLAEDTIRMAAEDVAAEMTTDEAHDQANKDEYASEPYTSDSEATITSWWHYNHRRCRPFRNPPRCFSSDPPPCCSYYRKAQAIQTSSSSNSPFAPSGSGGGFKPNSPSSQ